MGWGGSWEGGSGWGTHVNPWLIHVNVWQKPLQYCKVVNPQLIKINGKQLIIKKKKDTWSRATLRIPFLLLYCPLAQSLPTHTSWNAHSYLGLRDHIYRHLKEIKVLLLPSRLRFTSSGLISGLKDDWQRISSPWKESQAFTLKGVWQGPLISMEKWL